jgi:hypothetical protein
MIYPGTLVVPKERMDGWVALYPTDGYGGSTAGSYPRFYGGIVIASKPYHEYETYGICRTVRALFVLDSRTMRVGWVQEPWLEVVA